MGIEEIPEIDGVWFKRYDLHGVHWKRAANSSGPDRVTRGEDRELYFSGTSLLFGRTIGPMGVENGVEATGELSDGGRAYGSWPPFEAFAISGFVHFGVADDNEVLGDTEEKVHEAIDSILGCTVIALQGDVLL